MAHRYLQLSAGCRNVSRLLLPSSAPARLVRGKPANMLTRTAVKTNPNRDRAAGSDGLTVTHRVKARSEPTVGVSYLRDVS